MPLGSLPAALMIVLAASKTQKVLLLQAKITLFVIVVVVRYFEALDVLIHPILGPLEPIQS